MGDGAHPVRSTGRESSVGNAFVTDLHGHRHAGNGLHRVQASASLSLFSRSQCDRYFGGLWFKVFSERGPC